MQGLTDWGKPMAILASQYGETTFKDWCWYESARIQRQGRVAEVQTNKDGMVRVAVGHLKRKVDPAKEAVTELSKPSELTRKYGMRYWGLILSGLVLCLFAPVSRAQGDNPLYIATTNTVTSITVTNGGYITLLAANTYRVYAGVIKTDTNGTVSVIEYINSTSTNGVPLYGIGSQYETSVSKGLWRGILKATCSAGSSTVIVVEGFRQ